MNQADKTLSDLRESHLKIEPNQVLDSDLSDQFNCMVCHYLVADPVKCPDCSRCFCKACIKRWITNNPFSKCCPQCRGTEI